MLKQRDHAHPAQLSYSRATQCTPFIVWTVEILTAFQIACRDTSQTYRKAEAKQQRSVGTLTRGLSLELTSRPYRYL